MYFKKLVGDRVYLSPIDKNDYELWTKWVNDTEVTLGTLQTEKILGIDEEKEVLERLSKGGTTFAIVDLENDKAIGFLGLPGIDSVNRSSSLAITIGEKSYWNKGYGSEAVELLLDYGFSILNLHSINLTVYSFNKGAIESYKKSGFKEVGRYREAKIICGEKFDKVVMDILSHEYKSKYIKEILMSKVK